jgi:hypothetical protein
MGRIEEKKDMDVMKEAIQHLYGTSGVERVERVMREIKAR